MGRAHLNFYCWMNKKIASELAIGIILLLVIIFSGIFLVQNKKQEAIINAENAAIDAPIKLDAKKQATDSAQNVTDKVQAQDQQQDLTAGFEKDPCKGHLYEGDVQLRGRYVLENAFGDAKEWLFKVFKDDLGKLPVQTKLSDGRNVNELLKIEDADPAVVAKLKKATDENPETISVKGYYLHCEGGPIVSIQPAKLALGKYLKK